jgi:hypothetical protein
MGRRPWPRHHHAPKVLVADEWPGRRITAPIVPVAHEPPDNPNSQKIGNEENEPAPSVQVRPLVLRIGLEEYDPARDFTPPDCPQRMVPVEPVLMEIVIELPRREADGLNSKVSAADDGVAQPVRKLIVRHKARGQPPNGPCKFLSSAPIYQERFPTSPANDLTLSCGHPSDRRERGCRQTQRHVSRLTLPRRTEMRGTPRGVRRPTPLGSASDGARELAPGPAIPLQN